MSWLDENKDRGRHPPYDAKSDLLDLLRSQCGELDYRKMMETAEKAWEASQKIMGRDRLAGNNITSRMLLPELDPTKAFIPGIENSRPSEDPEIRIKVRKHKLKFNFNN